MRFVPTHRTSVAERNHRGCNHSTEACELKGNRLSRSWTIDIHWTENPHCYRLCVRRQHRLTSVTSVFSEIIHLQVCSAFVPCCGNACADCMPQILSLDCVSSCVFQLEVVVGRWHCAGVAVSALTVISYPCRVSTAARTFGACTKRPCSLPITANTNVVRQRWNWRKRAVA